jgi:putative aldouronate transport system permease protein
MARHRIRQSFGENLFDVLNHLFLIIFCFTIIYPFWRQILLSFSTPVEAGRLSLHLLPNFRELTLSSYGRIFRAASLGQAYFWTILRAALGTVLTLVVSAMMAYPLAKRYLPLRNTFTGIVVFTMFFGGGLIPTYFLVRSLHMTNTVWSLVIPGLMDPFTLIIIRNYMMSLPHDLEESARIDGASDITIFSRVIIPLSVPILATVAPWTVVGHWNSWFDAMIYITKPGLMVLQLLLRKVLLETSFAFQGLGADALTAMKQELVAKQEYTPDTLKAAILLATTAPILATYPFLQKYFVRGIMLGSLKG